MTPFFANYGFHPSMVPPKATTENDPEQPVTDISEQLRQVEDHLRAEIRYAQLIQGEQADRRRLATPNLQEGNQV
jgi:hypothetical protein